ncbi:hypothetical protein PR048_000819 [Dryococelus australis]|uniref:Uncharacterized protein n=1 Tax=Dryococelus australis TaxID=614101 RepID=A0ABQ9IFT2_9NEOP|nr:hypothetical protein PR048_000819 [Dryococelus australis]
MDEELTGFILRWRTGIRQEYGRKNHYGEQPAKCRGAPNEHVIPRMRVQARCRSVGICEIWLKLLLLLLGKRESCRAMPLAGRFSQGYPYPSPLHSSAAPFSAHFTLIGSQDLVKSHPNLATDNSTFSPSHIRFEKEHTDGADAMVKRVSARDTNRRQQGTFGAFLGGRGQAGDDLDNLAHKAPFLNPSACSRGDNAPTWMVMSSVSPCPTPLPRSPVGGSLFRGSLSLSLFRTAVDGATTAEEKLHDNRWQHDLCPATIHGYIVKSILQKFVVGCQRRSRRIAPRLKYLIYVQERVTAEALHAGSASCALRATGRWSRMLLSPVSLCLESGGRNNLGGHALLKARKLRGVLVGRAAGSTSEPGGSSLIDRTAPSWGVNRCSRWQRPRLEISSTFEAGKRGGDKNYTVTENRAGQCRWSTGFLGDLQFPFPFIPALLHSHVMSSPSPPSPKSLTSPLFCVNETHAAGANTAEPGGCRSYDRTTSAKIKADIDGRKYPSPCPPLGDGMMRKDAVHKVTLAYIGALFDIFGPITGRRRGLLQLCLFAVCCCNPARVLVQCLKVCPGTPSA